MQENEDTDAQYRAEHIDRVADTTRMTANETKFSFNDPPSRDERGSARSSNVPQVRGRMDDKSTEAV